MRPKTPGVYVAAARRFKCCWKMNDGLQPVQAFGCQMSMQKTLIAVILCTLVSCFAGEPDHVNFILGRQISLSENEQVRVHAEGKPAFFITVKSLTDSRCPEDSECVHYGFGLITIEFDTIQKTVSLGETEEFIVNGQTFAFTFLELLPYPTASNQMVKKTAVFIIDKVSP
jgi:hypothetical protein